ncbi:MAG: HlyD family efflux transporter periplasmic adaptor subunit [Halanaerobiales bacterium]|nr:HlyD family efflux transporter periplasmic adaptor subunit [Halanaerobiales bacterium]
MTQKIINLKDLSDSKEMLEAKEPNFIVIIIYFILILIIGLFTWMWFGELDITIKALGILRPAEKISVLRNINGGKLNEIHYYEGKLVKKSDILYKTDSTLINLEEESLSKEKIKVEKDLVTLKELEESIYKEENLLGEKEQDYYNHYLVFKYKYEHLTLLYNQAKKRYFDEKNLPPSFTTRNKLSELETEYIISRLSKDEYKRQKLIDVKNEIKSKENRLEQINKSLKGIKIQKEFNIVKAPISGVVQVMHDFNEGEYILAGKEILRIIPVNGNNFKVEMTVQNKDISQLEVGQKVKYNFLALSYKEYGTLEGEIMKISSDAIMEQGNMVYKIESSINDRKLFNNKGEAYNIKPGMKCEIRIVVRKKKILYFILEKLNFLI